MLIQMHTDIIRIVKLFTYLSIYASIDLFFSIYFFIHLYIYLHIHLSILICFILYLSIYLSKTKITKKILFYIKCINLFYTKLINVISIFRYAMYEFMCMNKRTCFINSLNLLALKYGFLLILILSNRIGFLNKLDIDF